MAYLMDLKRGPELMLRELLFPSLERRTFHLSMKREPMPRDALLMRRIRREHDLVPALPQLEPDCNQRMQIAQRAVRGEDDPFGSHDREG